METKMLTSTQMLLLEIKSAKSVCTNPDSLLVYNSIIERIQTRFIDIEKELIKYAHKSASEEAGFEYSASDWAKRFMEENFKDKI